MRSKDRCRSLSLSLLSLSLYSGTVEASAGKSRERKEGGKEGRTANIQQRQQRQQRQRWLQKHKNARDYAGVGGGDGGDGTSEGEHHLASQVVDFTLPSVVSRSVGRVFAPLSHDSERFRYSGGLRGQI